MTSRCWGTIVEENPQTATGNHGARVRITKQQLWQWVNLTD